MYATMKVETYNEIFNDTFCLEYLFEIKRNINNIETKSIFSNFIITVLPIIMTEIQKLLHSEKLLDKKNFYNTPYQKIVENKRHKILKTSIHNPVMNRIASEMGINFSECVYDLNISVSGNELLLFNFAMYEDIREYDDYVWSSLALLNADISNTILTALNVDLDCRKILQELSSKILSITTNIINNIAPTRYSYATANLFSTSQNLQKCDKFLILYRYEIIKSLTILAKWIDDFSLETVSLYSSFNHFILKIKAIIIHVLGRDFYEINTFFSQQIKSQLNKANINDDFYRLNGLMRTNLHYSKIQIFTSEQENFLKKKQDIYLKILIDNFDSAININLSDEVNLMTGFCNECICKGYNAEYIKENFERLYTNFINSGMHKLF